MFPRRTPTPHSYGDLSEASPPLRRRDQTFSDRSLLLAVGRQISPRRRQQHPRAVGRAATDPQLPGDVAPAIDLHNLAAQTAWSPDQTHPVGQRFNNVSSTTLDCSTPPPTRGGRLPGVAGAGLLRDQGEHRDSHLGAVRSLPEADAGVARRRRRSAGQATGHLQARLGVRQVISCSVRRMSSTPESGDTLPAGLPPVLLVRASVTAKGTAVACAVVAEPAPEGDGAAAIARAPRRYPGNRSALTRCRECRHPVPIPAISRTDGKSPKAAALHQERRQAPGASDRGCMWPQATARVRCFGPRVMTVSLVERRRDRRRRFGSCRARLLPRARRGQQPRADRRLKLVGSSVVGRLWGETGPRAVWMNWIAVWVLTFPRVGRLTGTCADERVHGAQSWC